MSRDAPLAAGVYVQILDKVEFFGVHSLWAVPRVGETVRLVRHDVEHTLTVVSVEHDLRMGHGIVLNCT